MRITELERIAHEICDPWGVEVVVTDGWLTRGKEFPKRPDGALRHWTVGPSTGIFPSYKTLVYGRGGTKPLPGPLCTIGQDRQPSDRFDKIHLISSGIANHAGYGEWNGIGPGGNDLMLGLEIEWSGPNEPFSDKRRFVSELGMMILMRCTSGTNPNDACEHREWCLPEGRKIDTNLDGNVMRNAIATGIPSWTPFPVPPPLPEEDMKAHLGMAVYAGSGDPTKPDGAPIDNKVYLIQPYFASKRHISQNVLGGLVWINYGGIFAKEGIVLEDIVPHPIWNPPDPTSPNGDRNIWGYGADFLSRIKDDDEPINVDRLIEQIVAALPSTVGGLTIEQVKSATKEAVKSVTVTLS